MPWGRFHTKEFIRKRGNELHKRFRLKRYNLILKYKNKPCMDCGKQFPPCAIDFDHRNPLTKKYNLGQDMMLRLSKVLIEIEKCDVVCANCHRIRTWRRKECQYSHGQKNI